MARSKSDIANSAIRIFLQEVGKFYDKERDLKPFVPNKAQKDDLLKFFSYQCCYCGASIDSKSISQDHLVPMNQTSLGLHAWGNVVPCCVGCNNERQQKPWRDFLAVKSAGAARRDRKSRIDAFVSKMKYDPNLHLHEYAGNLYEDVGEVAMTIVRLRLKQAEEGIKAMLQR